jgi:CMP-N-acetylneuraminic acid synthetase
MRNLVLITAKGGNQTVKNKNIIPIQGNPVVTYPIRAAKDSLLTDHVAMSTDCPRISHISRSEGIEVVRRPPELAASTSLHKDVIRFEVERFLAREPDLQNVVVLLGNTVMVTSGLIDRAFSMLESPEVDSVVSVWEAQDDHPLRALKTNEDGYIDSYLGIDAGSNRQAYPRALFYDQGIWAFRAECALRQEGPPPWVWLGRKCRPIIRPWVTGRDIHTWIDVSASAWYLNAIQAVDFMDFDE